MRLRHVRPGAGGYRRRRRGRGFTYLDRDGAPLRDPAELERIRGLVIPPAWRDVWICDRPNGHLQAVGTDDAGRRQYLYHPRFRAQQEAAKHAHVLDAAEALPRIRRAAGAHLAQRGLTRERVLACAARLLDVGFFRVGGEEYARDNDTHGLTTLLREHARCRADRVSFEYPAKNGSHRVQAVVDPDVRSAVRALRRRRTDGDRLFAYWRRPAWHTVTGQDVNDYLRETGGVEISAKDFRTWHATVLAAVALAVSRHTGGRPADRRRAVGRAVREVAEYLGNTPAVCRSSYINPRVIELYEEGVVLPRSALEQLGTASAPGALATHGPPEEAVLRMLRDAG